MDDHQLRCGELEQNPDSGPAYGALELPPEILVILRFLGLNGVRFHRRLEELGFIRNYRARN
jgi:hypothetical protein